MTESYQATDKSIEIIFSGRRQSAFTHSFCTKQRVRKFKNSMPYFQLRKQSYPRIRRHEREFYNILKTPETPGSSGTGNSEDLPSFEIQTSTNASSSRDVWIEEKNGNFQTTVAVVSEPSTSHFMSEPEVSHLHMQSRQISPVVVADNAVATAWLRMGETNRKDETSTSATTWRKPSSCSAATRPQNIFRRTAQWWTAPCLNGAQTDEEPEVTTSSNHYNEKSSFWRRKSSCATGESRMTYGNRNNPDERSKSKPGLDREIAFEALSLQSLPTTFTTQSSCSSTTRKRLDQTLIHSRHNNCCRINSITNQAFASLFDSPPEPTFIVSASKVKHSQGDMEILGRNNKKNNTKAKGASCKWKTAVDPKSGKTYYYHVETRETQWRKPLELASEEEKEAMLAKEQKQRDFFAAMEANILRNLQAGVFTVSPTPPSKRNSMSKNETNLAEGGGHLLIDSSDDEEEEQEKPHTEKPSSAMKRPDLVRTISSMDERILKDLVMRVPSHRDLLKDFNHSPIDVTTEGFPNNVRTESDGSIDDADLISMMQTNTNVSAAPTRPNALRASTKQPSLGTVLASLPEESEPCMESFGDLSMHNMGLTEQESQALLSFAEASSQMALLGDESFVGEFDRSFGAMALNEEDEQEAEDENEESNSSVEKEDESDPLRNIDDGPNRRGVMSRSVASHRVVLTETGKQTRPNKMIRRNTCGTLYVGSTMSQPDVDATIKCVCGVIRAHILQSEMEEPSLYDYEIFHDQESLRESVRDFESSAQFSSSFNQTPTLDDITAFYRDVFQKAQMESDCIIMSLIYVERLIKLSEGRLRPHSNNWRSVLFSCMVLASKVWDDLSMWNGDFSQTCPAGVEFTLQRINELELAVLDALAYKVKVPASEYAKYYFLLRAMLIKSGLGGDSLSETNPLDVEGARRLQQVSMKYQRAAFLRQVGNTSNQRSKSLTIDRDFGQKSNNVIIGRKGKVSLEHMVQM